MPVFLFLSLFVGILPAFGWVGFFRTFMDRNAGALFGVLGVFVLFLFGEFDPGSGRTLAACLTHASRTMKKQLAVLD